VIQTYPFNLEFTQGGSGRPFFAAFPFVFGGAPVSGISCGLSSRFAGDMVYSGGGSAENPARLALFAALGLERVYGFTQIHSRTVLEVDRYNHPAAAHPAKFPPAADGMVSRDRRIALSVTVADCLPVYLYDTESGAFGLVHSGWKGTGIALEALRLMAERWGTKPEAAAAVLGPCIDSCCYKVDTERAAFFEREFGADPPGLSSADAALLKPAVRRDGAGCYLDLKAANVRLLAGAGVRNIAVCADCTFTDERLGSFRREGEGYTRMAAIVFAKD
jgi:YfiH family protein